MYKVYCDNFLLFDSDREDLILGDPVLDLELNKAGTFEFTIFPEHQWYDELKRLKSIVTVYQDNVLIFRGRILNDEKGFFNERRVTCEGELAFLVDSIQRPYEFQGSPSDLFTQLLTNHNSQVEEAHRFEIGNVTVTDPNDYINRSDSQYLNTWESLNDKLLDKLGGYLYLRHENNKTYIDYLADLNFLSDQTIEFEKNLLEINNSVKGEDIATAVIPLGARISDDEGQSTEQRLTIKDVNEGVDYLYNQDAVDRYGWIFCTQVWDDVTVPENLRAKGYQFLGEKVNSLISTELTAADLSSINHLNPFRLGTQIKVKSNPHNLDDYMLVKHININLSDPGQNSLTLGESYESFTESSQNQSQQTQEMIHREVTENNNFIYAEVEKKTSSLVEQKSSEILQAVSENYYLKDDADNLVKSIETQFKQTSDEFQFNFTEFQKDLQNVRSDNNIEFQNIKKYIRFVDGNIEVGESDNAITLKIENDKISIIENNNPVAYFSNKKLYVTDGEFLNSLILGSFAFYPRENGNLTFNKVVNTV